MHKSAKKSEKKVRLDRLIFEKGLSESREKAKALILEGSIYVNGRTADKAGEMVREGIHIEILKRRTYVSRGGMKLQEALKGFHIDVQHKTALDVGASTGGFSDCLLQNGAARVYAVDVGYGQFDWKLRNDPRVKLLEKTNIRYLDRSAIEEEIDIVTIDVSFISLLKVIPNILSFLAPGKEIIAMIKPQFEAGRRLVGKGGVIRDASIREQVIRDVKEGLEDLGLEVRGMITSPILGSKGNIEYLIYMVTPPTPP